MPALINQLAPLGEDFILFGVLDRAYVKRTRYRRKTVFAVYAADGYLIGRFADQATAVAAAQIRGMEALSVH